MIKVWGDTCVTVDDTSSVESVTRSTWKNRLAVTDVTDVGGFPNVCAHAHAHTHMEAQPEEICHLSHQQSQLWRNSRPGGLSRPRGCVTASVTSRSAANNPPRLWTTCGKPGGQA